MMIDENNKYKLGMKELSCLLTVSKGQMTSQEVSLLVSQHIMATALLKVMTVKTASMAAIYLL